MTNYNLVYFHIQSDWGEELKYSLRSFEKYFSQLGEVWIFGDLPAYLDPSKLQHIPKQPTVNPGIFTHAGARRLLVRNYPQIGEDFLIASDDQYLLRPVGFEDFGPYCVQDLRSVERWSKSEWQLKLWRTYDLLIHMGYTTYNFESHTPMRVNRQTYEQVAKLFLNIEKVATHDYHSYCPATAYWNITGNTGRSYRFAKDYRIGFTAANRDIWPRRIKKLLEGKTFLFHDDHGLTRALRTVIKTQFPDKSNFEL